MFDIENIPEGASHEFRIGPVKAIVRRAYGASPLLILSFDVFGDPRSNAPQHLTVVLPRPGEDPATHDFCPHITFKNRKNAKYLGRCTGADLLRIAIAFEKEVVARLSSHTRLVTLEELSASGHLVCYADDSLVAHFLQEHVPKGGMRNLAKLKGLAVELFRLSQHDPITLAGREHIRRPATLIDSEMGSAGTLAYYPKGFFCNGVPGWYVIDVPFPDREGMRAMLERVCGSKAIAVLEKIGDLFEPVFHPPRRKTRRRRQRAKPQQPTDARYSTPDVEATRRTPMRIGGLRPALPARTRR